jgi:hypothetical protein
VKGGERRNENENENRTGTQLLTLDFSRFILVMFRKMFAVL